MMTMTAAVGDIHGRLDLLLPLLDAIESEAGKNRLKIVFLGDYVDRGPDSRGVVRTLMAGSRREGDTWVCLRGNHDEEMAGAVLDRSPDSMRFFDHFGAGTMDSYDTDIDALLDRKHPAELTEHARWMRALAFYHDDGERLFVHAGVRPGVLLAAQSTYDMMWIREEFLGIAHGLGRVVVHGHSIVGVIPYRNEHAIGIDTGSFYHGALTAVLFGKDGEPRFLRAKGDIGKFISVEEVKPAPSR